MIYTNPDPFNHGTTTLTYNPVSEQEIEKLSLIAKAGWNVDVTSAQQLSAGTDKSSNNFRVNSPSGTYVLKWSHISNPEERNLVNRIISYCDNAGVTVSRPILTSDNSTFYVQNKDIFCLYYFIHGEHFDGSREEVKNMAEEVAYLHKVLEGIPFSGRIQTIKGTLIKHDRDLLERIIPKVKSSERKVDFDIDEIDEYSKQVSASKLDELPFQAIHYDLHPHNVLFDPHSKEVLALLDFDPVKYSQRARDVSFAMHRFARTFGKKTERKQDSGTDMIERAQDFLEAYLSLNALSDREIKMLPLAIQDEALQRMIIILNHLYLKEDPSWSFDLSKQLTLFKEGTLFSF